MDEDNFLSKECRNCHKLNAAKNKAWNWVIFIVIIFLVTLLIMSFTTEWPIMRFIQNAVTLFSIALSVYTIYYSNTSSERMQRQFEAANESSVEIKHSARNLEAATENLNRNIDLILSSINALPEKVGEKVETAMNNQLSLGQQTYNDIKTKLENTKQNEIPAPNKA